MSIKRTIKKDKDGWKMKCIRIGNPEEFFCCKCQCSHFKICQDDKTKCPDCGSTLIDYTGATK